MRSLLLELYNDWFFTDKKYWFSTNLQLDIYLCDKYFDLLNYSDNNNLSKNELIALIIVYDQIPRHYCRVYEEIDVNFYSKKATLISQKVLEKYDDLTINELCFIYLPFRHINDLISIYKIIKLFINLYNNTSELDKITCKKYITNTLNKSYKIINNYYYNLDIEPIHTINRDILSYYTISNSTIDIENIIVKEYEKIKTNEIIVVSLSGGVDSMVALYILNKYHKNIIALHINYNNNEYSNDELQFVNYYCNYLNIKLIFRTIDEISRDQCNHNGLRDLYEDITKKIRFNMYHLVNPKYVLLGHNKDDCFENIITNIGNKNNYDNLSGMTILSTIDDLELWRPMLNIEKSAIIAYANKNNIPYLKDSTPKWSVRGKIRDYVRPAFNKINNTNMIDSFFILKENLEESNIIITLIVYNLINKLSFNNNIYEGTYTKEEIKMLKYITVSKIFFRKLNIKVSYKTLKDFANINDRKFILNKNNNIVINNEKITIS